MITFVLNGKQVMLQGDPEMPLLWALRDHFKLTGAKYGCGAALCGACTVQLNGQAVRACMTSIAQVDGKSVLTIEGLAPDEAEAGDEALHPVQQAWLMERVPQCGFCQSGQIISAVTLLQANPDPTEADIKSAMSGHLCRCGTYTRVIRAVQQAAKLLCQTDQQDQKKIGCVNIPDES